MNNNEDTQTELAEYADALDHIARTARASRTKTRRLRWIEHRAMCALEGGDWKEAEFPKTEKTISVRTHKKILSELERLLAISKCPDENCKDGVIPHQIAEDDWESQQCQFCYEREQALQERQ